MHPVELAIIGAGATTLFAGFMSWVAYVSRELRRHAEVMARLEERVADLGGDLGDMKGDVRRLMHGW